ncbi:MAG: hypothetical protein D6681_21235 [Calditrichaeota bacterium]|nr:MAG: hypothetical protein D6681_21235 [Calditrichota bacterium]
MLAVRRAVYARKETLLQEQPFVLGMGDRLVVDQPVGSGQSYRAMWHLASEKGFRPQLLLHWITRNTDWRWETPQRLQACLRAGYTPVIAFWYFGDNIRPEFVQQHREEYFRVIEEQLIPLIRDLPEVWILLEPEFNKNGMLKWKGWDTVAVEAIRRIHRGAPGARVGLAIGDWGDYEVQPLKENIAQAAATSDFIGMVEMMSYVDVQNSFDPGWEPVERIHRFAAYLQQAFGKPLLVAYMALSTAGGWEQQQARIIRRFFSEIPYLMHWGVMGACFFSLFDDPEHEGWFSSAERHFGLLTAEGQPKPGAAAWQEGEALLIEQDRTPPELKTPLRLTPVQVDFSAGERLEGEAYLSEWCRWKIEIVGKQSRARRTFFGAGERVFFSWEGLAEKGAFLPEVCLVRLIAYDRAGHPLVKPAHTTCLILTTPSSKTLSRTVPQPEVNLFLWGKNSRLLRPRYRGVEFMDQVQVALSEPPSGIVLIPTETAASIRRGRTFLSFPGATPRNTETLDFSSARQEGYLMFQFFPSTGVEGLLVGLTDREGVQSQVLLEAYAAPEKSSGEWRRVIIPLEDFPALGLRSEEGIAPEWRLFNWQQVTRFTLTATVAPVQFTLGEVLFLNLSPSPRWNR